MHYTLYGLLGTNRQRGRTKDETWAKRRYSFNREEKHLSICMENDFIT
jgi:hypothetical protein